MRRPEFIARQARRPSGPLGYLVAWIMARETGCDNAHTLDLLDLAAGDRVLEIGCGHGVALQQAVGRIRDVKVTGLDFSDVMVNISRERNSRLVAEGRVKIDYGDSTCLPYGDGAFTKAFSVHTVYFWTGPEQHLSEICRVLIPGGRLVLGFRAGDDADVVAQFPAAVYRFRTTDEIADMVAACGFEHVRSVSNTVCERNLTWVVAEKAGETAA